MGVIAVTAAAAAFRAPTAVEDQTWTQAAPPAARAALYAESSRAVTARVRRVQAAVACERFTAGPRRVARRP